MFKTGLFFIFMARWIFKTKLLWEKEIKRHEEGK